MRARRVHHFDADRVEQVAEIRSDRAFADDVDPHPGTCVASVATPVDPKPPAPRCVSGRSSTSSKSARDTGATIICAMRSPRRIVDRFRAEIGQEYLHRSAIVGIDRARRVEHGYAAAQREAAARPNLRFEAGGQRDRESRRDERASARQQRQFFANARAQIGAGCVRAHVGRSRQAFALRQAL